MRSERRPSRVEQLNVPTGKPDWTGAEQGEQRAPEVEHAAHGGRCARAGSRTARALGRENGCGRGLSCVVTGKWADAQSSVAACTKALKAQLRRMASNGRAPDQGKGSEGLGSKDELADNHGVAPAL